MWRVAAILLCFAYSGAWAASQRPNQVAAAVRLHHPVHGARVCSEHVEHNQIIIGVRAMPQSATVSVSINDVAVSTFPLEAATESQFLEVPLSGYDDSPSMASPGAHRISIAVLSDVFSHQHRSLRHVSTDSQRADVFTKVLDVNKMKEARAQLGLLIGKESLSKDFCVVPISSASSALLATIQEWKQSFG